MSAQQKQHRNGCNDAITFAFLLFPFCFDFAWAGDHNAPADFTITNTVLRPRDKVPPLGANDWGRCGAVEWAANNFVHNAGNEPIYWRNLHRVKACGPDWFEIDGPGTSWWDLWASGFLSGANLRIYRLVDKDGKPVPPKGDYLDLDKADHVMFLGKGQVVPEGTQGFPDGGWIANTYSSPTPNAWIRYGNLSATDTLAVENGKTYWYAVTAVGSGDQESDLSNEVSAAAEAGAENLPHLLVSTSDDKIPQLSPGVAFEFTPKVFGGQAPLKWEAVGEDGKAALPEGLKLEAASGKITGKTMALAENYALRLKVSDAKGHSDVRCWIINAVGRPSRSPRDPEDRATTKPQPPQEVKAVAGNSCVTLSWKPSPSTNVTGYRMKRSDAPKAKQMQRVFVTPQTPKLEPWDYAVLEKRFGNFDMKYVNPRVRGIGNPVDAPSWYWSGDPSKLSFSAVPHPQPIPAEMVDPGETCLQVQAQAGEQTISQTVFIGTEMGGESVWYGQLEPGKKYRLEVWLRQQGLGGDGAVTFSYGKGYPGINQTFKVTGEWRKYTCAFEGTERPGKLWHFGHQFSFTGPGKLWMDNCRISRCDKPEEQDSLYTPNATVLDELLASQPASGPKGAHRVWFLHKDATLQSIVSWHATSHVSPDWRTAVGGTMEMTLPMALSFDLRTGADPQSRMRPWLVLQHILHSEEDWLNFIEYLAAPYDPAKDTPQAKPWAYRRYQQRGGGKPWTDEFAEIVIEFGNETWHNGVFPDWIGFRTRNAVHQGGPEYGLFCEYLIRNMKNSPYWKALDLDRKIRFDLGANYDGRVDKDGKVRGYGEEAMQTCPDAGLLGHANYVGPKWETGDKSAGAFDDHGVQETLIAFLTGPDRGQIRMMQAHEALAKTRPAYDIAAYEGGPSGYMLPGRDSPQQKEVNEKYGKSLAMSVAALDSWLRSYQYGWTYQCFLGYGQGSYWNSHTWFSNGFRPSPSWQALAMRNRYASGDLMVVEEKSVPKLERKAGKVQDSYPLAGAYAMRDGNCWSVFVVSRKLDGTHDGLDFGDGCTPVTLRLPFAKAGKITLHKLSGDPRLSNREKLNFAIQTQDVPAGSLQNSTFAVTEQTGGSKAGLTPGSIYLYVFDGAE